MTQMRTQPTSTQSHIWRHLLWSSKMRPHGQCCSSQSLDAIYSSVSPADNGSIYKSQIFTPKEEVAHAVKMFSVKIYQQYFIYKSSKSLLKLKFKQFSECLWILRTAKQKGDNFWEIRKYKGRYTCNNLLMNRDHR